jgi:hypothetical protein
MSINVDQFHADKVDEMSVLLTAIRVFYEYITW